MPTSPPAPRSLLSAYLASALTGLTETQRKHVFTVSDMAATVCHELNISLYEPRKVSDPVNDPTIPDEEVFYLDSRRVRRADLLIYLADYPSTGAGQELIFAHEALVPVMIIAHKNAKVSRMVTGIPGQLFHVRYTSTSDLGDRLSRQIQAIRPTLLLRKKILDDYHVNHIGSRIRQLRTMRDMTHQDLARAIKPESLSSRYLQELEGSSDLESNLSYLHLKQIATALHVSVTDLLA